LGAPGERFFAIPPAPAITIAFLVVEGSPSLRLVVCPVRGLLETFAVEDNNLLAA
jgi:hypothetical protein